MFVDRGEIYLHKCMEYEKKRQAIVGAVLTIFSSFDIIISIVLSTLVGLIIIISVVRIFVNFYELFISKILVPEEISFNDFQIIFGNILTILINIEFLNTILKSIKSKGVRSLLLDVILISGIAVARTIILLEFEQIDPYSLLAHSGLLLAIAVSYFLVKKSSQFQNNN